MNEKIKELIQRVNAVQNVMAMGRSDGVLFTEYELEKFAELIVKKCCDAADMGQEAGCYSVGDYVGESLGYGQETGITNWRL